ncbi:306_t:CDS:2 [Entrophospora sp. SA101]|nr:306_t:CDS:2 [Entrophospora sp. SA101]
MSTASSNDESDTSASQSSDLTVSITQLRLNSSLSSTDEKEKNWWLSKDSLGSLGVEEERDVTFSRFAKRVEIIKARRFFDYRNGTITIIELPTGEHEVTHSKFSRQFTSAFNNALAQDDIEDWGAKNEYEEPDACFIPKRLLDPLNPAQNTCDQNGNPWPTIILEIASSETLQHVKDKIIDYWLVPNRCEDVIVIKIGTWSGRRHNNQTRRPLRRLRCLKFCRTATLQQNPNATTFDAIEEIEFGSVYANGRESHFCTGPHMKWITINRDCIYAGCPQPPQLPNLFSVISSVPFRPPQFPYPLQTSGVAIDLYDIQQSIFQAMGPN